MWSSQSYLDGGLERGFDQEQLKAAIVQSEKVLFSEKQLPSILTLNHLSKRTGVEYERLRGFVSRRHMDGGGAIEAYKKFSIAKRSGGRRFIHVPTPRLMHTQKWINEHILTKVSPHPASHAFARGNSIRKCAARHCGAKWLIKIDIADFFESVSEIQLYRVFKALGYQPLVAFELARLCTVATYRHGPRKGLPQWRTKKHNEAIPTYYETLLGYLPQGAPTSPLLANLTMNTCDSSLQNLSQHFGLNYTRYSDDMCFSTWDWSFDRDEARKVIYEAYKILSKTGFRPRLRKTTILPPGGKKTVLGLNVEAAQPRLPGKTKDRIRQHLYFLDKVGPAEHAVNRGFDSIWGLKAHLRGLIDFANMIEPDFSKSSLAKFNSIEWPV